MKQGSITRITIKYSEARLIRSPRAVRILCPFCSAESQYIPVSETAALMNVSERAVFRLYEDESLHGGETFEGRLMVCIRSIKDK